MSIQIGPYKLDSIALLAPMAGTSDKPFRMLCKSLGAGLTTSEMVVIQEHLLKTNKTKYRLDFKGEKEPISIQIAGSEAHELAHAAQRAVYFGADIIDINMGCPAKKVCNKASGSALMQDEILVKDILESVVSAVDIPVTLKMRAGWDTDNKNAPTIAQIAEQAGIQMLSVHGRTKADKYNGMAEYDTIKSLAKEYCSVGDRIATDASCTPTNLGNFYAGIAETYCKTAAGKADVWCSCYNVANNVCDTDSAAAGCDKKRQQFVL